MGAVGAAGPHVEEVRVAMALNGGVSLAVWMGGCAVELDAARRAHAAPETIGDGGNEIERRVYNDLLSAFRRMFVVDIMAGASAGGINGALLAAAARHERRLHPDFLRAKWLDLGDFGTLLHPTKASNPTSVMQGERFYDLAEQTFAGLLTPGTVAAPELTDLPADQADVGPTDALLDITVTNVAGEPGGVLDKWGEELFAREHRGRFEFRELGQFNAVTLATAARATASFPGAFEPFLVDGEAAAIAGFEGPRYAVDGGLLDNAPMRAAIELIPKRSADRLRLVKRFVCYLNADPPRRAPADEGGIQQPTIPDVVGYVINLPRNAPFYDQLHAVEHVTRRREAARASSIRLLTMDVDSLVATADALLPAYAHRRALESLEDLALDAGTARRVFSQLGDPTALPWVPDDLAVPTSADHWSWGILPGERLVHLLLDVVRTAVDAAEGDPDPALLAARAGLYAELDLLEDVRNSFFRGVDVPAVSERLREGAALAELLPDVEERAVETRAGIYERVTAATEIVRGVSGLLDPPLARSLFEAEGYTAVQAFIRRALAIEVVRRVFAPPEEIEPTQVPDFVQLTPVVPIRILSSRPLRPWAEESLEVRADSPNTKLTGIILGHFGGFYRHSWRANDFMWGRLDAATRRSRRLSFPKAATPHRPSAAGSCTRHSAMPSPNRCPSALARTPLCRGIRSGRTRPIGACCNSG
jgi:patatin-related protein